MKTILGLLFITFAANAETSQYSDIISRFARGQVPTKNELFGWFSGRCYLAEKPYQELAGLLAGNGLVKEDGNVIVKLMSLTLGTKYEPEYFDEITLYKRDEIARTLKKDISRTKLAAKVGNYLMSYLDGQEFRITKVGSTYLGKLVYFRRGHDTIEEVERAACEFTKKVY